ncbi:MAG: tetratricopeptide repeat protein [Gemmatimonadaceae bacterium]
MTDYSVCPSADDDDLARTYASGRMQPDAQESFEIHLLECTRCQYAVRQAAALTAALRAPNVLPGAAEGMRSTRMPRPLRLGIPLAAAAALAIWLVRRPPNELDSLARVDVPPTFAGSPVRAASGDGARDIDAAMDAYNRGDYVAAAAGLTAVERSAPSAAPASDFFLGIARLKIGDERGALTALRRARAAASPYATEAALYVAKAWLALGNADSALAALAGIDSSMTGAAHAVALADSIKAVRRR